MSREVRKLETEKEFHDYARICISAYPGFNMTMERLPGRYQEMQQNDPTSAYWGVFEDGQMVGGMRLIDYQMNYFGRFIPTGGVGMVAVDLIHKKRHVAKDIIQFFIDHFQEKGAYLTMLYSFRPDFYHQMGFGYGLKQHRYSFQPSSLPRTVRPHGVVYLTPEDTDAIEECYNLRAEGQHGYCRKSRYELESMVKGFSANRAIVGYRKDGQLLGYVAFGFKKAHEHNSVKNDLVIKEWIWNGPEALATLCSFLNTQADQINRIIFDTQKSDFHFLLKDVRSGTDNIIPPVYHETNTSGLGLMYRITAVDKFLESTAYRNFNEVTADLVVQVEDTFCPDAAGSYRIRFADGLVTVERGGGKAIDLALDVTDLSALLMGSAEITTLYDLGRVRVAPEHLGTLRELFRVDQKPECITAF
ncbi:MAG: GNAT family N-acetyltransferase [Bacillota bacterium]